MEARTILSVNDVLDEVESKDLVELLVGSLDLQQDHDEDEEVPLRRRSNQLQKVQRAVESVGVIRRVHKQVARETHESRAELREKEFQELVEAR